MSIVPKGGRAAWHAKAMDAAQGADLDSLIELGLLQLLRRRLASVVTDPLQSLRTLPPGSGGRRACASWTPRKASITTLRCQISRTPSDVRSGRNSPPSGRLRSSRCAPATTVKQASCPGLRLWRPARVRMASRPFSIARRPVGADATGVALSTYAAPPPGACHRNRKKSRPQRVHR